MCCVLHYPLCCSSTCSTWACWCWAGSVLLLLHMPFLAFLPPWCPASLDLPVAGVIPLPDYCSFGGRTCPSLTSTDLKTWQSGRKCGSCWCRFSAWATSTKSPSGLERDLKEPECFTRCCSRCCTMSLVGKLPISMEILPIQALKPWRFGEGQRMFTSAFNRTLKENSDGSNSIASFTSHERKLIVQKEGCILTAVSAGVTSCISGLNLSWW